MFDTRRQHFSDTQNTKQIVIPFLKIFVMKIIEFIAYEVNLFVSVITTYCFILLVLHFFPTIEIMCFHEDFPIGILRTCK